MNGKLLWKLGGIAFMILLLMLALATIERVVRERQARRDAVVEDIARSSSGPQLLAGPVLVVPYTKTVMEWRENENGQRHQVQNTYTGELQFLPEVFRLEGDVQTERRARGIYEARLYHADLHVRAEFKVAMHYGVPDSEFAAYSFSQPRIAVGVLDIRGIGSPLTATLNDAPLELLPGAGTKLLSAGVHAFVPSLAPTSAAYLNLTLNLPLLGTSALSVLPLGKDTQIDLKSNWPHPSFTGEFLPVQHTIYAKGFTAHWATTFFSTNLEEILQRCEGGACSGFTSHPLGVSFVDPVDQYLKTDRAIKYALLFIALTFAGFFLFDVLKALPIHAMQYGLVGAALALFYLLLLSLSEHISFSTAYLVSAAACVVLIAFYVSHVLHSLSGGLGFGCGLAGLYAALFGLVTAEDYALLMGSLLLFAVLAAVMVLTRNVDWTRIGAQEPSGG